MAKEKAGPAAHGPDRYGPDRSRIDPSVEDVAECRDVYDLIDHNIRLRPTMWVRGGSLQELEAIFSGYWLALQVHSAAEEFALHPSDGPFARWLASEYGWSMALGWASAIENHPSGGEMALDAFFRLLDEYRSTGGAYPTV
ncbi:hypothetical protein [Nocardia sp. NBC_01329]|uniref:hypothetical protein n=1 Tax=Nocardia sp. NBC_01329 TaxID=2903594 RepID=UPI002E1053AF|nr:hypothetical protein OG405_21475 [Nocardia sp. NBC_01329]